MFFCNNKICFFQYKNNVFVPSLKILMEYPSIMKSVQVDEGAIKHILSGSDIMCPGLTSKGGRIEKGIEEGTYVEIMCENKQHPAAIGLLKMSSDKMFVIAVSLHIINDICSIEENKGIGIQLVQFAGDGIWADCLAN